MAHSKSQESEIAPDGPTVAQLASQVAQMARELARLDERTETQTISEASSTTVVAFARRLLCERRDREKIFGGGLFADPAWDMMLDLFIACQEGKKISISSLCIASAVPPTTALRWIRTLVDNGMFVRRLDPDDRRRVWTELAPHVRNQMRTLLSSWQVTRSTN